MHTSLNVRLGVEKGGPLEFGLLSYTGRARFYQKAQQNIKIGETEMFMLFLTLKTT